MLVYNSFHMLKLVLFQVICKAADHLTENDLYNCTCIIFTCIGEKISKEKTTIPLIAGKE